MTNRKTCSCGICESSNLASVCIVCVNYRLNEYYTLLKSQRNRRDQLYSRLTDKLVAKGKADEQLNWKIVQNEKIARLKEKLRKSREQLLSGKSKLEKLSSDLKETYGLLEFSQNMLEKHRVEQLEKSYPNWICTQSLGHMAITSERLHKQSVVMKQICKLFPQRLFEMKEGEKLKHSRQQPWSACALAPMPEHRLQVKVDNDKKDGFNGQYDVICNARLPRGLNPHSVPSEELSASLGYMVQLLNLVVQSLCLPALHNSGFAGSCSRIWQRDSYWDARPSSRSNEYPLFIPRQNCCSTGGENSWSERSSHFEVTPVESGRKPRLDPSGSISFNYACASQHSMETHNDLQRGIALLKKSVACVTAYCYNSLCLDVPTDASTFEAFANLLATLSSSCKQVPQLNKSVWNLNSMMSSTMLESPHTQSALVKFYNYNMVLLYVLFSRNMCDKNLQNHAPSFLYATDVADVGKNESLVDGWDLVEYPKFPPPPSETEDIEHWTRAMFTDATKK
ncbi:Phenylalanine--tRNA ligase alpha subunit [Bienertia sinuspersici]